MNLILRLLLITTAIITGHLCVLAQHQTPASTAGSQARLQLEKCTDPRADSTARCGTYEVFEDRTSRTGRKIALNVMVLPATGEKARPDPLFFIAGGPGQSAVSLALDAGKRFFSEVRQQRDIVLVDQRG